MQAPDPVIAAVMARLGPVARPVPGVPDRWWTVVPLDGALTVTCDGSDLGRWPDPDSAARALTGDLELWVAEHARRRVFIHAGCVVIGGGAVLLPGRTMAGKSTLVAALVAAGATYFSDEYAVLDSTGLVYPYRRPIGVRAADEAGTVRSVPTPVPLSATRGRRSAPVALVAGLRYVPGAVLEAQDVGAHGAALLLIDNAVAARSRPRAVLSAVSAAVAGARGIVGQRGDAAEAAGRLGELLGGEWAVRRTDGAAPA